jgi:hypothetical protein
MKKNYNSEMMHPKFLLPKVAGGDTRHGGAPVGVFNNRKRKFSMHPS